MNMWIFLIGILLLGIFASVVAAAPVTQVTAHILDEQGQAIEGAHVSIVLILSSPESVGAQSYLVEGLTDGAGNFTGSGESEWTDVTVIAEKDGYYQSGGGIIMDTINTDLNRWEPWNPTITVILKKIRNPVPMYYKQTDWIKVPVFGTPVGYDLVQGDWVTPYGKGAINDFVFIMTCRFESMTNAEAKYILTFSNPGDGIQIFVPDESNQSVFKWPFSAPLDGYQPRLEKEEAYLPGQGQRTNIMKDIQYIFRVRTGQEMGTIRGPLYGKINGEINISRDGYIDFTYWLNPDGTPNLEENSDRNLFDEGRRPQKSLRDILLERQQQQKQP